MSHLYLVCFQSFSAWLDNEPISFRSTKGRALLVYLAIEQTTRQRSTLAGLLWPDEPESRARKNLSQTLLEVRKAIGDVDATMPVLQVSPQTIGVNPDSPIHLDVFDFQKAVQGQNFAQAVELYKGPFLNDFHVPDSELFESWLEATREQFLQQILTALSKLATQQQEQGRFEEALHSVRRQLELAPWQEEAHCQLMRLLALSGQRSAALAQYDSLTQMLMDELGVSPAPETDVLYDQILAGDLTATSDHQSPATNYQLLPAPFQVTAPSPHFVGRNDEIETVRGLLNRSGSNVVALVGMGGLGKTTLATQIAHTIREDFPDGVLWANPAISSVMDILDNWGRAYGCDFSRLSDIESRGAALRGVLAEKSELLILDNVTSASQVKPMLTGGEGSPILITTRDLDVAHALNAEAVSLGELSSESGQALLVKILGESRVAAEKDEAALICKLLHYLPLAVEIAAQRLKSRSRMTLTQMARRLSDTGQRLGLKISDQAVRTSFEVSWEGLDEELQALFPLLAVFEGRPFTVQALAYVAEMDEFDVEDLLYGLNALSLVNEDEAAYFRQHPLLADFASEKLVGGNHQQQETVAEITGEKLGDSDSAYRRLVNYYLEFVEENQQNYERFEPEWGNIMAAMKWVFEQGLWSLVVDYADALQSPWFTRARYNEARQGFGWAHEATEKIGDEAAVARNLLYWGEACLEQSDYEEAKQHLNTCLAHYREVGNLSGTAKATDHLARIAIEINDYKTSAALLAENLAFYSAADNQSGIASVYFQQARIDYVQANLEEAQEAAEKALLIQTDIDDRLGQIRTARLLSQISWINQAYDQALLYCQKAQTLSELIGDMNELAITLYVMTPIRQKRNEHALALEVAEQSLTLLRRMGDARTEGMLLSQLSEIHDTLGNVDQALKSAQQSVEIARSAEDKVALGYALLRLEKLVRHPKLRSERSDILDEVRVIAEALNHLPLKELWQARYDEISSDNRGRP